MSTTEVELSEGRKVRRISLPLRILRDFEIAPVTRTTRTGLKIQLQHCYGSKGVAMTKKEMLKRYGLEKEVSDSYDMMIKKITDHKQRERLAKSLWSAVNNRLTMAINQVKKTLSKLYQPLGLKPLFGSIPSKDKGKDVYCIVGFVDLKTNEPMIGDLPDLALWAESTAIRTKSMHDKHKESIQVAKGILKLGDINKDIQQRMGLVISGDLSRAQFLEYAKGE